MDKKTDVIERWRQVYDKRSLVARFQAWLVLKSHAYGRPATPNYWYALLGVAILLVLILYVLVVREIVK